MIGFKEKILSSEHLKFRLLEERDKVEMFNILHDPRVTIPAGFLPIESEEDMQEFWSNLTMYNTAVAILLDKQCIGYFHVNPYHSEDENYKNMKNVSVGIVIGKEYQSSGYGKETVRTLTEYLMQIFDHVWADTFVDNIASQRLFLSSGFKKYGECDYVIESLNYKKMHLISYVI